jgi:hypothetical protein
MKRLLSVLGLVLFLCALVPSSARAWWWSHHRNSHDSPGPAGAGATSKAIRPKKEKHLKEKVEHLYNSPKSWGWLHKSPGPMGAGS